MGKIIAAFTMVLIFVVIIAVVLLGPGDANTNDGVKPNGGENTEQTGVVDDSDDETKPNTPTEEVIPYDYDLSGFVNLVDYKDVKADDALIEEYIEESKKMIATQYAENKNITDRPVQNGDTVNIDYVGKYNGVAFEGGTAKGADLEIGSGSFIPGFEEGLIGKTLGETVDLNLKFPDSYHNADLAGKEVVFTVSINKITEVIVPELTDKMVEDLKSDLYNTVDGLVAELRVYYTEAILWEAYAKACEIVKYPEKELNNYIDREKAYFTQVAATYGMTFADYIKAMSYNSEDEFMADLTESVKNGIKTELVIYQTVRKNNITVTDEEYQKMGLELALSMGVETLDQLESQYTKQGIMLNLYQRKIAKDIASAQQ